MTLVREVTELPSTATGSAWGTVDGHQVGALHHKRPHALSRIGRSGSARRRLQKAGGYDRRRGRLSLEAIREGLVTSILFTATHGSDDPTKATIPFIGAVGALEAGHRPRIALLGEGAYLAIESVVDAIHGIGFPPLSVFFSRIIEEGVPVYV